MKSFAMFIVLAGAMLTWPKFAAWFVYSCLALFAAYAVIWIGCWLWCLMNLSGRSNLPENMQ